MLKNSIFAVIGFIIGFITFWYIMPLRKQPANLTQIDESKFIDMILENAPEESLRGTVTAFSGNVTWYSRISTQSANITTVIPVQQGETIETKEDGTASLQFSNGLNVTISPETKLSFIQTLPEHIVIAQETGTAQYTTADDSNVAVRSMPMILELSKNADVEISSNDETITVDARKGFVECAYNDSENITTKVKIEEGTVYVFDAVRRIGEFQ